MDASIPINPDRANDPFVTAQAAYDLLRATPFVWNPFIVAVNRLFRSAPGQLNGFATSALVHTQMHSTLTGDQTYTTLQAMRHPARGAGRIVNWVDHMRQATAPPAASAYTGLLAAADATDLGQLLDPGNATALGTVLAAVTQDPLTLFPTLQTGLTPQACASAAFIREMVARCSSDQIFRAVKGTAPGTFAALGAALNGLPNGWNWLDGLSAASLSPVEHALLGQLHAHANATGQAKITVINATQGASPPGVPFATAFAALQSANPPATAQALRGLLQTATHAERAALFGDAAKATFIFGLLPGNPFVELSIPPAERGIYLQQDAFFLRVLNMVSMVWTERVEALTQRAYIMSLGARFTANDAAVANFISTSCPGLDEIAQPIENDLRAITLASNAPQIANAIRTKFDDQRSSADAARPADPEATQSPIQRIAALLAATPAPANLGAQLVSFVGRLGATRQMVSANPARMNAIRAACSDEQWFQCVVDLQLTLSTALTQLRLKGHTAQRLQTLITAADATQRSLALRDDANVAMVRADIGQDPLRLMLGGGALTGASFDHRAWRTWVLEVTPTQILLPKLGGTPALAAEFAPKLDQHSGWGFLARCADGPALMADERAALANLRAATGRPQTAAAIRAKTDATTQPATPAAPPPVAPPPPPGAPPPPPPVVNTPSGPSPDPSAGAGAGAAPPPPTLLQQFQAEVVSPTANATRFLQLSNQVTEVERNSLATSERARIVALLSGSQLVRFVQTLPITFAAKLAWIRDKGGAIPIADLSVLVAAAPAPERISIFDDVPTLRMLRGASNLGPLQMMGLAPTDIPQLRSKLEFWEWAMDRVTGFEILSYLVASADVPATMVTLGTVNRWALLQNLPSGTGLPNAARDHIDAIFTANTIAGWATFLFEKRFGVNTRGWAATNLDDIRRLYAECLTLPIAHIANNPRLVRFQRGTGGGGNYAGNQIVNINQDALTGNETHYAGTATPVAENYFDHTVRHEIGHSVDAMLGGHTSLVYGSAGWKIYNLSQMDQWINSFGGWNAGGGPTPNAADKEQIRQLIRQLVQSGGGQIDGPNQGARELAPAGHAFQRFPMLKVVEVLSRHTGTMKYISPNRVVDGGKVFTINYYYRQFLECNTQAGLNVPRDYCMFSPSEWFADMYAEYYRVYDGQQDNTLGGNCPGFVKTWFYNNVHRLGGRSPSELRGRALPRGQRVAS